MALLNRHTASVYDTPPDGDFVRYLEQMLARQMPAAAHAVAGSQRPARAPSQAATPLGGNPVAGQAQELLDRIRQMDQARKGKRHGSASTVTVTSSSRSPAGSIFAPASDSASTSKPMSGPKLLGIVIAVILGIIFPPLGIVMLIAGVKKAMSQKG